MKLQVLTTALSILTLFSAPLHSQAATVEDPTFDLSVRSIMRGPELVGEAPVDVRWTDDGSWVYFRWRPGGEAWHEERHTYRVRGTGGAPERLSDEAADSLRVLFAEGDLSTDRRRRVSAVEDDLWLVDRRSMAVRRLTETVEAERSPTFSADGAGVFFTREGNLFSLSLADGAVRQLTDIRQGPAPKDDEDAAGHKAFLEAQQEELFEHIRIRKQRDETDEADEERRESRRPTPFYRDKEERVQSFDPDPSARTVAVTLTLPPKDERRTVVPEWVTQSGYTDEQTVRTKVGDAQSRTRIGMLAVATGEIVWLDLAAGQTERPAPAAPADSAAAPDAAGADSSKNAETADLAAARFVGWNDAGTHGLAFAVDSDHREWRIYAVARETGEMTLLANLYDETWVGGPCFMRCAGWIPETDRAWYVSEATGFAHLYAVGADGEGRRALTSGEWEVLDVSVSEDRARFHLQTNEVSPFDQHFATMAFDGSARVRVTFGEGRFEATPSPDGRRLAVVHSVANRPPELYLAAARPGAELDRVTTSPTEKWLAFGWIRPEIVHFTARDGVQVPARIYRPAGVSAQPNGAAVVFVHGAGYLQNVHRWWSSYYREYMFHHLLASRGYTVLDIDYRGSAGHGRDWRTAIYRHMGGADLTDQVDGARWLVAAEGVDPSRIGIYGGSYGGFITLMALFTEPDTFHAGAALRSVTDWAHYNHRYTSRILTLPHEDEEAYRRSSPIYFADGFRGHLLIAHGMVDVNVHFSDVVRLAQRLIELGKENWEMAVYPVEDHGFVEPASWTDEYRRILELFERTIGNGAGGS
jgi:dipeptidyl aminopeptidase/acylaminoacyl peptidase